MVFFRKLFYSVLLISILLFASLRLLWAFNNTPLANAQNQIIYVAPKSSIYSLSQMLHSNGLLASPKLFIIFAILEGKSKHLKAGEYLVNKDITAQQLLNKIVAGKVFMRQYTIVEGWNLKQVYRTINANPYLTHTIDHLPLDAFCKKLGIAVQNFEGTYYPDTYLFAKGVSDVVILKKAFWNMQKNLDTLWKNRAANLPYTDPYSALIVASLIERETAKPEERAKIAGVIVRRLQQKMLLQIDAAVIYGLGDTYTGKLTRNDLKIDTPYNTYLHEGLPPTPIGMPSIASIYAALHPSTGTSLYYVARGDGSHEFTDTLAEHHEAIKKYRVQRLDLYEESTSDKIIPWFNTPNLNQLNVFPELQPFGNDNGKK